MTLIDVTLSGGDFGGEVRQIEDTLLNDLVLLETGGRIYSYRIDFLEEEDRYIGILVSSVRAPRSP